MKKLLLWCLLPLMVFGQNMLKNTGFEEKGENGMPVNWGGHCTGGSTAGMTTETSYSGQACGYIIKIVDGKSHVAAITQGRLAVEPETEYLLTAMAKGSGTLFGYEYDANGKWLRGSKSVAVQSEDWVPISTRFKTSKDTKTFEVRFELFGKEREGKGWVDDVRFGTPQPQPQPPQNFVAKYDPQAKAVKLSWTALEGMRYYVSRSRYPDNANTMVHASNLTSGEYEDKDVPKDWSRVFYRLTAADEWNQRSEPTENVEVLLRATNEKGRVVLWTDSVMNKYRRYAPPREDEAKPSLSISLAIRETEARQIVVYAENAPIQGLDVKVSELKDADGAVAENLELRLLQACYSMVRKTTCDPKLKLAPGLYADALPPLQGAIDVPLEATQSIWVQAETKAGCKPGKYAGVVTVTDKNGYKKEIPLNIEVFDFELPVTPSFKSALAVWPSAIERGYDVEPKSAKWQELWEKYYWFMADRRMGAGELPYPIRSEEARKFLTDPRVAAFQIPSGWGKNMNLEKLKADVEYLRENGWLDRGYVYCFDEPNESQYDLVVELAEKVHSLGKDVQFIMTEQPEPKLLDSIDIWVPILGSINWDKLYQRRKAGQHLWWYTCCWPKAPYPTYLIDDCGTSHRILSWLQAKYGIEGVLYWCVNVCTMYRNGAYQKECNVWEEAEMFPDANGDGFMIYPGKQVGIDGPVTSIRLELIRDGNEDFEYFQIYRQLLGNDLDAERQIQAMIAPVAVDLTHWDHDPKKLEAQRNALARKIMSLKKK